MFKRWIFITASVFLLAASIAAQEPAAPAATPSPEPKKSNARPQAAPTEAPPEPFDKADVKTMAAQCVTLDTEAGLIALEMYPESAPESVRSFLNLAATGLFDNTTFSRVVPGFVIQGGSLSTAGKWTWELARRAQRTLPDEPNSILHERGVLSMARGDEPNTATTHFFILVSSAPSLDRKFAAFGRVTKGMDVVDAVNKATVVQEKPDKPIRIKKATVATCAQ